MSRFMKKGIKPAGLPPGTPFYVGNLGSSPVRITFIAYSEDGFREGEITDLADLAMPAPGSGITWLNIDGVHRTDILERIGTVFSLHPLLVEDIANTEQRPKAEDFENRLFTVMKMLTYDRARHRIEAEQVSIVIGERTVLSFQERVGDIFDPIRNRIREGKGKIRKMGADYLAYSLVDAIVDNYFVVLEGVGDRLETLEDEVLSAPEPRTMQRIHDLKREMLFLRKVIWPLRETISGLERAESPLITKATALYFRDVYDHCVQVMDAMETFRDMASGLLDTYLSTLSNRMNEVMKVLTVIATTFIPLTFIAGVYGMNFRYMPELQWKFGYPAVLLVMLGIVAAMLVYFKKRRWL